MTAWPHARRGKALTRSCSEPRATLIAVGGASGEDGVVSLRECGIDRVGAKSFLSFPILHLHRWSGRTWTGSSGCVEGRKGRKGGQERKGRGKGRREGEESQFMFIVFISSMKSLNALSI